MWWLRHLLFSPDAPAGGATETEPDTGPDLEVERQRTMAAADEYLQSTNIGDKPRDERGRFVSTKEDGPDGKSTEETTGEAVEGEPGKSGIDPVWIERAKIRGFNDDQISEFKTDADVETAIIRDTITAARKFGADPLTINRALQLYQQHGGQPPAQNQPPAQQVPQGQPQQAGTTPLAMPEFKLELPEDLVDPQVAKAIQSSMTDFAAQVKATVAAELQKRDQKLEAWETEQKQSAEARQAEAEYASNAAMFDRAAAQVPGMVEFFGKPSELDRISKQNPADPKVLQFKALAPYLESKIQFWAGELGWNERALSRAFQDAVQESPFANFVAQARSGSRNGNGAAYGNGSVVRSPGRTRPRSESLPPDGDIDAEAKRIMAELEAIDWQPGQTVGAAHGPV